MTSARDRVVKESMKLYRYWVKLAGVHPDWFRQGVNFWYPLGSEKYALPFGKACAALARSQRRRGSRARG
jgi:hypothetical protein